MYFDAKDEICSESKGIDSLDMVQGTCTMEESSARLGHWKS